MSNALNDRPNAEKTRRILGANVAEDGRYMPPPTDSDGKTWVRTSTLIQGSPEDLYRLWRNLEGAPLWQEEVVQVRNTGAKTSHWVVQAGLKKVEWDAEILADEPGKRIAWRTTSGDLQNAGEVIFEEATGGRGTIVSVLQEFGHGRIVSAIQTLFNRSPKQLVIENLRHFKALAETGEIPRIQGQPHGPRGVTGTVKASAYGEHIPVPPGLERKAS